MSQPYLNKETHIELSSTIKKQTKMMINFRPSQEVIKNLLCLIKNKVLITYPQNNELVHLLNKLFKSKTIKREQFLRVISLLDDDYHCFSDEVFKELGHIYYC